MRVKLKILEGVKKKTLKDEMAKRWFDKWFKQKWVDIEVSEEWWVLLLEGVVKLCLKRRKKTKVR